MNILGISPHHHSSVCLLQEGEIIFFSQEERIYRKEKYCSHPFKTIIDVIQHNHIDYIAQSSPGVGFPHTNMLDPITSDSSYFDMLITRYHPEALFKDYGDTHHLTHAFHSFYNSGFKEAIGVVIDGLGSRLEDNSLRETETFYYLTYPAKSEIIFQNLTSHNKINPKKENNQTISSYTNLSRCYEQVTTYLGWGINEAGKTMGLAPYGKVNSNIPNFFVDQYGIKYGNPQIFIPEHIGGVDPDNRFTDSFFPSLSLKLNPREWHHNKSKITDLEKDIAWKIQNNTQQIVGDYIEKSIQETGLKQVCCSGGYFLNVITNYYLIKRFPDIKFYFEPIANDAGTAIGAAKLLWHQLTDDTTIRPFKSLYLGKKYTEENLKNTIKKYCKN
jgi:carbamoyltransferase